MGLCKHEGCKKHAIYNFEGEPPRYCGEHKEKGMVDVKNQRCEHAGCKSLNPTFNFEGEKKGKFCSKHKEKGMVDVKNRRCERVGCKSLNPVFNFEGEKKGKFCSKHKEKGMVDVIHPRCKSEWCPTRVSGTKNKYDGHCHYCFINLNPGSPLVRNYKTKEFAVGEYIKSEFPDYDWIFDKKVYDGCSKRRPDIFLDLGDKVLIVEIDEYKHSGYNNTCENKRIMEISQDLGHRPLVFIRFNPDGYTTKDNKKVRSCWQVDKTGKCKVKKTKEWETRLKTLQEKVIERINKNVEKMIEIEELYYE